LAQRVCGRSEEEVELQREHSRFLIGGIVVTLADELDAQQDLRPSVIEAGESRGHHPGEGWH
jgi:hypothetical protein